MDSLVGSWRLVSSVNREGTLKAIGVPQEKIDQVMKTTDVRFITKKIGDLYRTEVTSSTNQPGTETTFKLGKEFITKDMIGNDCKNHVHEEGEKVVQRRVCPGKYEMTITWTLTGDQMTSVHEVCGITATNHWEKC